MSIQRLRIAQTLRHVSACGRLESTPEGLVAQKNKQTPWVSRRFLLAALHFGILRFPVGTVPGDRPDLRLKLPDLEVGVEITETVSPSLAQASQLLGSSTRTPSSIVRSSRGEGTTHPKRFMTCLGGDIN